jgi:hypothetical protein
MKYFYTLLFASLVVTASYAQRGGRRPNTNDTISSNYVPKDVFSSLHFTDKGNEFHSANGDPGPKYWKQKVDYLLKASIDTGSKVLSGTENITYTNNSPDALSYLWVQLDQNNYKADARSNFATGGGGGRAAAHTNGYELESVSLSVAGKVEKAVYVVSDTRMQIRLPKDLAPNGGKINILIKYHYTIPANGGRTDYFKTKDGTTYEIAQWFPRMCVYDDTTGWDTLPFLGSGEFYCEYGDIDYSVTAPSNIIIAGSGELVNPLEVLTPQQISRLAQARASDKTIMIRTAAEAADRSAHQSGRATLTWHFKMYNTRDVAFGASNAYIWDAARINLPGGKKSLAMSVYPVESAWERSTEYLKGSIEYFSQKWFTYPYPVAINEAGHAGGMEYPGILFDGMGSKGEGLFSLIAHEIGHNWFPMVVGSDERRFAFMDEGFNTFIDIYASDVFNKGEYAPKRDGEYAPNKGNPADEIIPTIVDPNAPTIMTAADAVAGNYRHPVEYFKPAFGLVLLREQILGKDRFDYAFRNYIHKWAYKHPQPDDFFRSMESGAGEDLSWFWKSWFYNNYKLDLAIIDAVYADKADPKKGITVTIANKEKMPMPFYIEAVYKDGTKYRMQLPVETWIQTKAITFTMPTTQEVASVSVDPDAALPDINRKNNIFKVK